MPQPICFIGHTHELMLISCDGRTTTRKSLKQGIINLSKSDRHIINVGSIGQPRDGNNNSKYIIWDTDSYDLEVKYVAYDIDLVAKKIMAAGLPRSHAVRLY